MRYGSNLFGCLLTLLLCCAAPVGAAEGKAIPQGFLAELSSIIGGILAILFIGGVFLWQISQRTDCTSEEMPATAQTKFKPLYKLLVEPGIIGIFCFAGMYFAYPYIARAMGVR